jgi:hypothetical protein
LRELLNDDELVCHSTTGYQGRTGDLWYVRLCPPVAESFDYHIVLTTPYVLIGSSREDWTGFLNRSLLDAADKPRGLRDLLKYGSDRVNWCEFVFQAFHHGEYDAIFLTGLPDMAGSLPHSPQRETLDEPKRLEPPPSSGDDRPSSGNVEELLRCKLTEAQRKISAELCPDLAPRLKLAEKNERSVELTRREVDRVLEPARAALTAAESFRKRTLKMVVKNLADATRSTTTEQARGLRTGRGPRGVRPVFGKAAPHDGDSTGLSVSCRIARHEAADLASHSGGGLHAGSTAPRHSRRDGLGQKPFVRVRGPGSALHLQATG